MFGNVSTLIKKETVLITLFKTRPIWGLIPVRLAFGLICLSHGFMYLSVEGQLGWAFINLAIGALVVVGLLIRVIGLLLAVELVISIVIGMFSYDREFFDLQFELLFLSASLLLFLSGAGRFSVDRAIARRLLKRSPDVKHEAYVIAETIYTKM